jgi:uncharacterized membrane protein
VPGTIVFYLPELFDRFGLAPTGFAWLTTAFKTIVGCWLLWHAMQLSDQETRASRLHEATLPAKGYLGRFLASTLLFWGGLFLMLWPAASLISGTWDLGQCFLGLWSHLRQTGTSAGPAWVTVLLAAASAVPAGLWSVYGWFHGYYVADEGQGAWQSMVSSYHSVEGAFGRTLGFLIVIATVNALGLALWFAGIFIAFPVTLMATTYVHLELKRQAQAAPKPRKRPRKGR